MSRFKLLMAVSADGFCARGPDDDMRWTGPEDKLLFKLLSTLDGGVLLAGRRTAEMMPKLPLRRVVPITRQPACVPHGLSLNQAACFYEDAWLIGGPTVALAALQAGMVERAYINVVPVELKAGLPFAPVQALLPESKIFVRGTLAGNNQLTAYFHLNGA